MKAVLVVTVRRLARTFLIVSIARSLNTVICCFGLTCVANRYSGSLYFYSNKKDKTLYSKDDSRTKTFLNVGSGQFRHSRWTNIDLPSENVDYIKVQGKPNVDFLPIDLRKIDTLPFSANSVDAIYSSHCIEHLPINIVQNLFHEFRRILRPAGTIRITCPDAELYASISITLWNQNQSISIAREKLNPIHACLAELDKSVLKELFSQPLTPKDLLFRISNVVQDSQYSSNDPSDHVSWWTRESLVRSLRESGFEQPILSIAGESRFEPMRNIALFDNTIPELSLFVEADKEF